MQHGVSISDLRWSIVANQKDPVLSCTLQLWTPQCTTSQFVRIGPHHLQNCCSGTENFNNLVWKMYYKINVPECNVHTLPLKHICLYHSWSRWPHYTKAGPSQDSWTTCCWWPPDSPQCIGTKTCHLTWPCVGQSCVRRRTPGREPQPNPQDPCSKPEDKATINESLECHGLSDFITISFMLVAVGFTCALRLLCLSKISCFCLLVSLALRTAGGGGILAGAALYVR